MLSWLSHRRGAVSAVAVAGALALAGCGGAGSANGSKVASLNDSGATTTTAKSKVDFQTAALNYAKCMRAHGVKMPDPTFDANGRPQFDGNGQGGRGFFFGGGGGEANAQNPTFQKARDACRSILSAVQGSFQLTPAQIAQREKDMLAFAKCMRDNGVNFPDPTFDANGRPQFGQRDAGGGLRRQFQNNPTAQKAFQACQQKLGNSFRGGLRGGAGGGSTPTTTAG